MAQGDPQSMPAFGPEDYKYNYIEPAATAFKEYAESFDANIQFVVDKDDLRKDFKNNAAELARLDEFVKKATKIEGAELHTVCIYGYASPEAPFDYNFCLLYTLDVYKRQSQEFVGKQLYRDEQFKSIAVVKPGRTLTDQDYVDGISGGTLTSNGVNNMLWSSIHEYLPYIEQIRSGQAVAVE